MEKKSQVHEMYKKLDEYYRNSDYKNAKVFLERTLNRAKACKDLELIIASGNEVAGMYRVEADITKALETYELVLQSLEKLYMTGTAEYAIALMNTANSYGAANRWDTALKLYKESLELLEVNDFEDQYTLAAVKNGLSRAYAMNGFLKEAESSAFDALINISRLLPESYSEMATTYSNIAEIRLQQGLTDDAEVYFRKAIDIFLEKLQERDIHYANACYGLGKTLLMKGDRENARKYYRKAMDLIERDFGKNDNYSLIEQELANIT